jgi:hypothetical protein
MSDAEFLLLQDVEKKKRERTKFRPGIRTQILVIKDKKKCKNPTKDKIMGRLGYKKIKCGIYVKKTPVIRRMRE